VGWIDETLGVAFKASECLRGPLQDQFLFATAFPLRPLVQTVRGRQKFSIGEGAKSKFFSETRAGCLERTKRAAALRGVEQVFRRCGFCALFDQKISRKVRRILKSKPGDLQ
jgi:hypothetical protein